MEPDFFARTFRVYWDLGYQLHVHVNGDAGLDMVLDQLEHQHAPRAAARSPHGDRALRGLAPGAGRADQAPRGDRQRQPVLPGGARRQLPRQRPRSGARRPDGADGHKGPVQKETSMHTRMLLTALVIGGLGLAAACQAPSSPASSAPAQPADSIYTGGDIVTVDDAQPYRRGGRRQGRQDPRRRHARRRRARPQGQRDDGRRPRRQDAAARLPRPAQPLLQLALGRQPGQRLRAARRAGQGRARDRRGARKFRDARARFPKGELIQAYGYDDNVMPGGALLNRDDLDRRFPDNPVLVGHVSMHGAVLNSAALKKYGISAATKTPAGRRHRAQARHERAVRADHGDGVPADLRVAAQADARSRRSSGRAPARCSTRPRHHDRARRRHARRRPRADAARRRRPAPTSSTSSPIRSSPTSTRCSRPTRPRPGASTTTA